MPREAMTVVKLSLLIVLLNIVDALLSGYLVPAGFAIELNPVADFLLGTSTELFTLVKLSGVSLACLYTIFRLRNTQTVPRYIVVAFQCIGTVYTLAIFSQLIALGLFHNWS